MTLGLEINSTLSFLSIFGKSSPAIFSFNFAVFIKKKMKVVVAYQNALLPVQLP